MVRASNAADSILIIDQLFPMADKFSGGLRLFSIVSLLKQRASHVTFIARNGGYQDERYRKALEAIGIEIGRPIDLKRLLTSRHYSVAYLSIYDTARQYLPSIRSLSPLTRIVIDTVDIHFLRRWREAEVSRDREAVKRAESAKKVELAAYAKADALVTVTEQDWQHIEAYLPAKPHFVIPSIFLVPDIQGRSHDGSKLLFIGNFNHSPNTDAVLYFTSEIFPLIKKAVPDITLEVVGDSPPDTIRKLQDGNITVTGYVPSTGPYLQRARVSIAPIRYGAGIKGKIVEAMAYGLPVITTSVGAEGMGLVHGETAFVADTPAEFAHQVVKLCSDDVLWTTISENARVFVEKHYSQQAMGAVLDDMLRCLAGQRPYGDELPGAAASGFGLRRFWEQNIGWRNYDDAYRVCRQYLNENMLRRRRILKTIGDQYGLCLFFLLSPLYIAAKACRKITRKLLELRGNRPLSG